MKKKYFDELKKAMNFLGSQKNTIFIGQAVEVPGTAMSNTLSQINRNKLMELPVAEEMQMGISLGLAMEGYVPISIFPRWNFLLYGVNQLINHIDKFEIMNGKKIKPKIIIRTSIGSQKPLHPQHQHIGDYSEAFRKMSTNIEIIRLKEAKDVLSSFKKAYYRKDSRSTILVEYGDFYNEK